MGCSRFVAEMEAVPIVLDLPSKNTPLSRYLWRRFVIGSSIITKLFVEDIFFCWIMMSDEKSWSL